MGAYIHYGLLTKAYFYTDSNYKSEDNLKSANKFISSLIPIKDLQTKIYLHGIQYAVPNEILQPNFRNLISSFQKLYNSIDDEDWKHVMMRNWEDVNWDEFDAMTHDHNNSHFWFDSYTEYFTRNAKANLNLVVFESEGKVNHECLAKTFNLFNALIRKELSPNPLAPYFYIWIS